MEIRRRRNLGEPAAALADEFGVSSSAIRQAVRGVRHKYLEEAG